METGRNGGSRLEVGVKGDSGGQGVQGSAGGRASEEPRLQYTTYSSVCICLCRAHGGGAGANRVHRDACYGVGCTPDVFFQGPLWRVPILRPKPCFSETMPRFKPIRSSQCLAGYRTKSSVNRKRRTPADIGSGSPSVEERVPSGQNSPKRYPYNSTRL